MKMFKHFFHSKHPGSILILIICVVLFVFILLIFSCSAGFAGDRTGAGSTGAMIYDDGGGGGGGGDDTGVISCGAATPPTGPHTFPLARYSWYGGWLFDRCGGTGSGNPHAHGGADIMHTRNDHVPVYAVVDGFIRKKTGSSIYLKSTAPGDTYIYYYTHQSQVLVSYNQSVSRGQLISYSGGYSGGAQGDHTHFGMIRTNGCNSLLVEVPFSGGQTCSNTTMAEREQIACSQTCLVNPTAVLRSWQ